MEQESTVTPAAHDVPDRATRLVIGICIDVRTGKERIINAIDNDGDDCPLVAIDCRSAREDFATSLAAIASLPSAKNHRFELRFYQQVSSMPIRV